MGHASAPAPGRGAPRTVGAVLCGGASRRMGTDKATLLVDGRPLAGRALDALVVAGVDEVLTVGGDRSSLMALAAGHLDDDRPGEGPLAAVATAAAARPGAALVVLPCDLVAVDAVVVRALVEAVTGLGDDGAAVAEVDGVAQWAVLALGPVAAAAAAPAQAAGERALRRVWPSAVRVVVDPAHLHDVDDPAALERWRRSRPAPQ